MDYDIRRVAAADWEALRDLRLRALSDPLALIAFTSTHAEALALAEAEWRSRARVSELGENAVTFVAVGAEGGRWLGMVTALEEREPGREPEAELVGVYVLPRYRGGSGPAEPLMRSAISWCWENWKARRVRLHVHEDNPRARAFYARLGFTASGARVPARHQPGREELELELLAR